MADTSTASRITQVGRVVVPVSDQDKALAFYAEKLGFEKRMDAPFGGGNRWLEVGPPGGVTGIALVPPMGGGETGVETGVVFETADLDALHTDLDERGVDTDDVMGGGDGVPPMFFFRDQDGNRLLAVEQA